MQKLSFILLLCCCSVRISAQLLSSNLPIIIVDTQGAYIEDEPKTDGYIQIIYNEDGERNKLEDNLYHFEGNIGIELRGQSSLALFPKKGFGIETRKEDGSNLNTSLFGWPEENDWVIHSPYSDKSLIRNLLAYDIASEMMPYAPRTKMCELIINDMYYGVVLFTEKIKRDKGRVAIGKLTTDDNEGDQLTGGYILKFDKAEGNEIGWLSPYRPSPTSWQDTRFVHVYPKPEDITSAQSSYIQSYITDFEDALAGDDYQDSLLGYRPYIDESTFIDQIIINELTRNVDGYRLSTYMYKDRDSIDSRLKMGPVWDFNLAFSNANYCLGWLTTGWAYNFNDVCPDDFWVNHFWWKRLLSDPYFFDKLKARWQELRVDLLSNENINLLIDERVDLLSESQVRNFNTWKILDVSIWPNNFVGNSYPAEIEYLRSWTLDRVAWLDKFWDPELVCVVPPGKASAHLYPNPVSDNLSICLKNLQCFTCTLSLFDGSGKVIYSSRVEEDVQLDVSGLVGFYFYNVTDESKKVIDSGKVMIAN